MLVHSVLRHLRAHHKRCLESIRLDNHFHLQPLLNFEIRRCSLSLRSLHNLQIRCRLHSRHWSPRNCHRHRCLQNFATERCYCLHLLWNWTNCWLKTERSYRIGLWDQSFLPNSHWSSAPEKTNRTWKAKEDAEGWQNGAVLLKALSLAVIFLKQISHIIYLILLNILKI